MIVIAKYRVEMVIETLVVDRLSASASVGSKRMRRSVAPSCHDLKRRRVISMNN
jgi:hypothetical protein